MNASGNSAPVETTYVGEDENEADPVGLPVANGEPATVLLVDRGDLASGQADQALRALTEQQLAPIEVIVVPGEESRQQPARQER